MTHGKDRISMTNSKFQNQRRTILQAGASALIGLANPSGVLATDHAPNRTLKILRWKHFIPNVEYWFNKVFVPEWAERNNVIVEVSSVGLSEINQAANAESIAGRGHDLVEFVESRADLEDHFIDHRELFEQGQKLFGNALESAHRTCFNPRTNRYHGFCTHYSPAILTYRKDLWDSIGRSPDDWDSIRSGGRAINLLHDMHQGISLSNGHNAEHGLSAVMSAFGSFIQDADGITSLASSATLDVLKFVKAMYEESMPPEVLTWSPASNNHFMLSGQGSLTIDTLSIARAAENKQLPVEQNLSISLVPMTESGSGSPAYGANNWAIWKFSRNSEAAKQFLLDYVAASRTIFLKSGFQEMPSFPGTVPDGGKLVVSDPFAPDRYAFLKKVPKNITNFGYPGYSNAAIGEVRNTHIIPNMFRRAISGELTPEQSMAQAHGETERVFSKWRSVGKI